MTPQGVIAILNRDENAKGRGVRTEEPGDELVSPEESGRTIAPESQMTPQGVIAILNRDENAKGGGVRTEEPGSVYAGKTGKAFDPAHAARETP